MTAASLLLLTLAPQPDPHTAQKLSERLRKPLVEECAQQGRAPGEVIVCGRRRDDPQLYQVTDPNAPFDPTGRRESVMRERGRWAEEGEAGIQSCSAVGPGGWTGCTLKQWRKERQQTGKFF